MVYKTKKKQNINNPEKLATQGIQDEEKTKHKQSRESGNIEYTRRRKNKT